MKRPRRGEQGGRFSGSFTNDNWLFRVDLSVLGYRGIGVFGYLDIWIFGYLDIWIFGYLGIWVFGYWVVISSDLLEFEFREGGKIRIR